MPGGSGRVHVGDTGHRVVSADTMRLLSAVRRGAGDGEPVLGMIRDMETLGVLLLGGHVAERGQ